MIENVVLAVITASITFIGTNYLKEHSKYEAYINDYYIKVLETFYSKYKGNESLSVELFYKGNVNSNYHIIPTYIHVLATEQRWDDMKKIFVIDYINNRPKLRTVLFNNIQKIGDLIGYILFITYLIIGILMGMSMISDLPQYFVKFNILQGVLGGGILLILWFVYYISLKFVIRLTMQEDYYVYNKKEINKIIHNKLNSYDRRIRNNEFI